MVAKDPTTDLYDAHFGLVLTQNPPVCHQGYGTPQRDPHDLRGKAPMNENARCTEPQAMSNARGAQNAPAYAGRRCVGAQYDRRPGKLVGDVEDDLAVTCTRWAPTASVGKESWKWLSPGRPGDSDTAMTPTLDPDDIESGSGRASSTAPAQVCRASPPGAGRRARPVALRRRPRGRPSCVDRLATSETARPRAPAARSTPRSRRARSGRGREDRAEHVRRQREHLRPRRRRGRTVERLDGAADARAFAQ